MDLFTKCSSLDKGNMTLTSNKFEHNLVDQPKVKTERDELDFLNLRPDDVISPGYNAEKPIKIKIEVDEDMYPNSTDSCDSKQLLEYIEIKNEVGSEEYHIPFKDEVLEDFSSPIEKQCHGGQSIQNITVHKTTKRKLNSSVKNQNTLSTSSRDAIGSLIFKECYNQCRLCGRVFLTPPEYFFFHLLFYHSSAKYLKRSWFPKRRFFRNSLNKVKIIKNNRFTYKMYPKLFLYMHKWNINFESKGKRKSDTHIIQYNKKPDLLGYVCSQSGFKCEICFKDFSRKYNFIRHMHCHTSRKQFNCEICSKQFRQKSSLKSHIRRHSEEKLLQCEICLKQFRHKGNLKSHMRFHTGEKPYTCEICLKPFGQRHHLVAHMRCHTGDKPFKCDICLKQFSQKSNLQSHAYQHTSEKPFKCDICSKQFIRKNGLTCHLVCHTGEKKFKCEICSKKFSRKGGLMRHIRCHTGEKPFKCEICLRQFTQKISLQGHIRCHTGEKPFKCQVCLKGFTTQSGLMRHMRCHTGEKPFKCEICFKQFYQKNNLTSHMRSHNGEKPFKCETIKADT